MPVPEGPPDEALFDTPPSTPDLGPDDPDDAVQPDSSSPAPSSEPPGSVGSTPGADEQPTREGAEHQEQDPVPFDERHKQDFTGLMYLGQLTDSFDWLGHSFQIRTLTTEETIEIGLLLRPYQGTEGESKMYQVLSVASAVLTVDGRPLPEPLGRETVAERLKRRAEWVSRNWYPTTIDAIYEKVLGLEYRVRQVLHAMGNPSG